MILFKNKCVSCDHLPPHPPPCLCHHHYPHLLSRPYLDLNVILWCQVESVYLKKQVKNSRARPVTSTTRMSTKRATSLHRRENIFLFLLLFSACLAFKQIKAGTHSSLLLLNSSTILFSFFNLQSNNWHWIMQWNIIISLYTLWTLWDWRNIFTCFVILVCIRQISRLLLLSSNYFISYLKCFFWTLKTWHNNWEFCVDCV